MRGVRKIEPMGISPEKNNYTSELSRAFNWYNGEVDRKEVRGFIRNYVIAKYGREPLKVFDRIPESHMRSTFGWLARLHVNGNKFSEKHQNQLDSYVSELLTFVPTTPEKEPTPVVEKPSVRDYMQEKVAEYLGELEHALDCFIHEDKDFDLRRDMQSRAIPAPYTPFIEAWVKKVAGEFIGVYNSTDSDIKEAYGHIGKRKLTQIIKLTSQWLEDLQSYNQFKKANRKPRAKKTKPPGVQVAKLKYKREDTELGIKSVLPAEMIGASQVWIYNSKYKKLAVYRTDSTVGIQVKGSSLQNYEPEQCEQKTLRKPKETLSKVLEAGKVQLRRILPELTTKESPVNGRINDECIILRVIR